MLNTKFYINNREVFPKNNRSIKLVDKLIDDTYYQKSLNSSILLWGEDYDYLYKIKNNKKTSTAEDEANNIYSIFDTLSFNFYSSTYRYTGEFTIQDCTFNDYYKTVEVKITTRDDMTYIKENENTEVNIFENIKSFFDVKARKYTYYSFFHHFALLQGGQVVAYDTDLYTKIVEDYNSYLDGWPKYGPHYPWSELLVSEIGYFPINEPIPEGWTKTQTYDYFYMCQRKPLDIIATDFSSVFAGSIEIRRYNNWIKGLHNQISFGEFYSAHEGDGGWTYWTKKFNSPNIEDYKNDPNWIIIYEGDVTGFTSLDDINRHLHNDGTYLGTKLPYFIAIKRQIYDGKIWDGSYYTYRCMDLKQVLSSILKLACPLFKGDVVSSFLFNEESNDPDKPNDFYGTNNIEKLYYALNRLAICELSGFIRSTAEQKATVKKTALKKWTEALKVMGFDVGIDINSQGNFRIEHMAFYTRKQKSKDIRSRYDKSRNLPLVYSFNSDSIPNREYFESDNTWGKDFTKKTVLYGRVPTYDGTNEITLQHSQNYIYTDIDGLNEHITSLPTEGFVMMYIQLVNGYYYVEHAKRGVISGLMYQNVRLSLANLINLYHVYNSFKETFYLEDKELKAKTLKRLRTEKLSIIDEDINDKFLQSELGEGQVTSIEYPLVPGDVIYNIELLHE